MAGTTISGSYTTQVAINSGQNTVTITGTIITDAHGLYDGAGDTGPVIIGNYGTIVGSGGKGVDLLRGGIVTNAAGGTIGGYEGAYFGFAPGSTMVNAGHIFGAGVGPGVAAVAFANGGVVTNLSSGTITGGNGIRFINGAGTVVDAGHISASNAAVVFRGGYHNSLTVDPGASFNGLVDGGNTIGSSIVSTLELASGSSAGTLSNLGSQFINFARVTVDAGASWTLASDTLGGGYTIVDAGTLTNTGSLGSSLTIGTGGALINVSGATIAGYRSGVYAGTDTVSTVINAGVIVGVATSGLSFGVWLADGTLINQSGGTITGAVAGVFDGYYHPQPVTAVNYGRLYGVFAGAALLNGAEVTNAASGVIAGNRYGVYLRGDSTLLNAGSIMADVYAVDFGRNHANRLIVDPGAHFSGIVNGANGAGATAVSTLELASGASAGTLSGLGSQFIDFARTTIDAGAWWVLTGTNTLATLVNDGGIVLDPSTLAASDLLGNGGVTIDAGSTLDALGTVGSGQTISFYGSGGYLHLYQPTSASGGVVNFAAGDTIDLTGVAPASVSYGAGTLSFAGGSFPLKLAPGGTLVASASADGTELTALCFCRDTMILTPSGDRCVQDLAIGDLVTTASGRPRPIVWIGAGKVLATRGRRNAATPVIVRKGAIAPNVPARDLHVTKGHSLYFDGVLIPVEELVNHRSILWDDRAQEVELYHVELATHDVLIANGALAESYRDDGNRWLFQNANSGWAHPPQRPCAPVVNHGPVVDALWRRLLDRAGSRPGLPLTAEADLHLLVDGVRVNGARRGDVVTFRLARRPNSVRIVSRAAAPQELGQARDPRILGVAVRRIVLALAKKLALVEADDERLVDGFHRFEPAEVTRWTNGDATLPADLFNGFHGPVQIELTVAHTVQYVGVGEAA